MAEFIYALTHYKDGEKKYFYVGRSEREPGVRFAEHRLNANTRSEDVYRYIRESVQCQIFEEEVLCWCEDENSDDYEDFYVVKLIREGHDLKNSKHGDAKRIAATELAWSPEIINTVRDVRLYKERKAREAYERSEALKKKVKGETQRVGPLTNFLRQTSEASRAAQKLATEKKQQRAAKKKVSQIEHELWLQEQSHLFESGEIDALGNKIK